MSDELGRRRAEVERAQRRRDEAVAVLEDALARLRAGEFDSVVAVAISEERGEYNCFLTPMNRPLAIGYLRIIEHKMLHHEEAE